MTTTTTTGMRELDHRHSDGIDVRLLWDQGDNRVHVAVSDRKTGESFIVEVREGESAANIFQHPFAYADRGVPATSDSVAASPPSERPAPRGRSHHVDVRAEFNAIVGNLEYPMFIVTARAGDERLGCLIGFATQTSIDPPRFAVCLSRQNRTHRRGRDAPALAVHCVPADAPDLAELFGGETGDEVDKFARCAWHDGPEGLPILDRCVRWFVGRVLDRLDAGDHELFLLEPVAASAGHEEDFTFHRAKRIEPGHPA